MKKGKIIFFMIIFLLFITWRSIITYKFDKKYEKEYNEFVNLIPDSIDNINFYTKSSGYKTIKKITETDSISLVLNFFKDSKDWIEYGHPINKYPDIFINIYSNSGKKYNIAVKITKNCGSGWCLFLDDYSPTYNIAYRNDNFESFFINDLVLDLL